MRGSKAGRILPSAHCVSCEGEGHTVPSLLVGEGEGQGEEWRQAPNEKVGSLKNGVWLALIGHL